MKSVATIEHFTAQITEFTAAARRQDADHRVQPPWRRWRRTWCNWPAAGIPVLDVIEAGARRGVAARRDGASASLAPTTINSNAYARRMHELDPTVRVGYSQACPVRYRWSREGGWTTVTAHRAEYLRPVLAEEVDSPVLAAPITRCSSPAATSPGRACLIDSALTTAELAAERLQQFRLARGGRGVAITASW